MILRPDAPTTAALAPTMEPTMRITTCTQHAGHQAPSAQCGTHYLTQSEAAICSHEPRTQRKVAQLYRGQRSRQISGTPRTVPHLICKGRCKEWICYMPAKSPQQQHPQ